MKKQDNIQNLIDYAIHHEAVNHPYLIDLQQGRFPQIVEAIKDFAYSMQDILPGFQTI